MITSIEVRKATNSTRPRNLPFYERLGFRSTRLVEVAPGVTFRSMQREPQP